MNVLGNPISYNHPERAFMKHLYDKDVYVDIKSMICYTVIRRAKFENSAYVLCRIDAADTDMIMSEGLRELENKEQLEEADKRNSEMYKPFDKNMPCIDNLQDGARLYIKEGDRHILYRVIDQKLSYAYYTVGPIDTVLLDKTEPVRFKQLVTVEDLQRVISSILGKMTKGRELDENMLSDEIRILLRNENIDNTAA